MRARALLLLVLAAVAATAATAASQDREAAKPCSAPQARDFDFWVGRWTVTAKGNVAGFNTITSILDGCVLLEEYANATGSYSGKSFNYYDDVDGKWHQVWVDTGGLRLHLVGGFAEGKMRMSGHRIKDGGTIVDRITWYANADGSVRQLWESSRDDGVTWTAQFDGLYTRE